ncbi:MAG: hypothetical protein KGH95_03595 [Thaumarchaeota archaeon]|nr:hypothetical protein [Nitrososphaerota archaeon]
MKTPHISIITTLAILTISILGIVSYAYADTGNSTIQVNGTQYEIDYKTTNVLVKGMSAHLNSYYNNRLDFDIVSNPTQNGSMTVSMSKEAMETIFCYPSWAIGDTHNDWDFTVSTDKKYGEEFDQSANLQSTTLTFDVPANSSRITFYHMFVGMAVADPVQYAGIPSFGTYHQGEMINFTGIVQDGCNRRLPYSIITTHAGVPSVVDMKTHADKQGIFNVNFTMPSSVTSGRYKMEINGLWGNMSGKFFSTLLVEQNNETNVSYRLEDPRLGTFVIPYHLDGGEISDIGVDPISNILTIRYDASHSGTLEIRIPQDLMDFVGTRNDITMEYSGLRNSVTLIEHLDSQGNRVFDLPVIQGNDNVINIQGITYGKDLGYDRQGIIPVRVNGTFYPLPYNITNGALQVTADTADKALKLRIYTIADGGHLHLVLPRKVIDSTNDGVDKNFVVMYMKKNNIVTQPAYYESQTSNNTRTLEIDFGRGETIAYIYGTYLVPELPFAVPVLLIGFVSLIVLYRIKVIQ